VFAAMTAYANALAYSAPNRKLWVYGILLILVFAGLAYYGLQSRKDRSINHDYYRVLYEASNTFNENLQKLNSMLTNHENIASIRSLLPSYSMAQISKKEFLETKTFFYIIKGQYLEVTSPEIDKFSAKLAIEDILPIPKQGFSQYLFANEKSEVLARVGNERTISIVGLTSINQQIQRKNKQFQFNFSEGKSGDDIPPTSLPSYSNHVDMKISYGDFRVFVFPFALYLPLQQVEIDNSKKNSESKTGILNLSKPLDRIFLVGLLPQHQLESRDSGYWNVSLLIVALVSLVFFWCMLRLFLLPKNQSITRSFRVFTNASSYVFYIVLIALILAYFQKSLLQIDKDKRASQYASYLNQELTKDIYDVFSQLSNYRGFYTHILQALQALPDSIDAYSDFSKSDIDTFNNKFKEAIIKLNGSPCDQDKTTSKLPGSVGSQNFNTKITYDCHQSEINVDVEIDNYAMSVMWRTFILNKEYLDTVDFYSKLQTVVLKPGESLTTSISRDFDQQERSKILTVFSLNHEGNTILPSIYFQESNSLPKTFNLSHRNYYKMVRDQKGWDLNLAPNDSKLYPPREFKNIYIQRLLNINNGTRGTTISMPIMADEAILPSNNKVCYGETGEKVACNDDKESFRTDGKSPIDHIVGADVLLPSMTLGQSPPYDFTYMVVDRSSGEVLFHNDSERSLVENLYFSGDIRSPLNKWLKAGLDHYPELGNDLITGTYHGQQGRFAISKTVVDKWAIVVFYPNDSLQTFMTNQFLYVTTTFCVIILIMVIGILFVRQFVWTSTLKKKLNLPSKLNIRLVFLVSSVLFSLSYCLYILGLNIDNLIIDRQQDDWSWTLALPLIGILVATLLIYRGCYRHFCYAIQHINQHTHNAAKVASRSLIIVVLIGVSLHVIYLQATAQAPQKSLDFHYQQLTCNWLNYEHQELINIGLSRYPNSITTNRIPPIELLPLSEHWRNDMKKIDDQCTQHSSQVSPDDYPKLSSVFGATYIWQWINIYLLDKQLTGDYLPSESFNDFLKDDSLQDNKIQNTLVKSKLISSTILFGVILTLLIWFWFKFNIRILWDRLYCPERFLQHINRITNSVHTLEFDEPNQNLKIECDTIKLNGIGLSLLLRSVNLNNDNQSTILLDGFDALYHMTPSLQKSSKESCFLPNIKLNLTWSEDNTRLNVELWDIEICLEKSKFRQMLLELIIELKSLTLSGHLNSITIFTGFHSLQRVKMKDPLMLDQSALLDHAEYLAWAECLMDFVVCVPESFKQGIDWQLLKDEVSAFPELKFLNEDFESHQQEDSWVHIFRRDDELTIESRWTTINYILLNAEALYRFKWESCSSAEKLALLNLAKKQKLNPRNTQMIEHLALNGLITVRKGNLDIINHSFAHFVLHAETAATLNQLVVQGEAGIWKNYKIPVGILILLIIVGIALTSGESIYIIAASMAGVLGTIASVTNSANLLRGQSQD
jgi:hypothetical protein